MSQLLTMHSKSGMLNWFLVDLILGVQGNDFIPVFSPDKAGFD